MAVPEHAVWGRRWSRSPIEQRLPALAGDCFCASLSLFDGSHVVYVHWTFSHSLWLNLNELSWGEVCVPWEGGPNGSLTRF